MSINPLNKDTIKLITTTQVITSVFSVVKELVENAVDARATNVEVKLEDDGTSLIEVRDDGEGVPWADVPRMTMPHYTSKISNFDDLDTLYSYGFRGEALNSMCRVADVEIITKTAKDESGTAFKINYDGEVISSELIHRSVGTTVRVSQLFKNFFVRRQMITQTRKAKQSIREVETLLKCIALCQPDLRISLRVNSQLVFMKPNCTNVKEAMSYVIGKNMTTHLHWIEQRNAEVKIQLMIPECQVQDVNRVYDSNHRYISVNNRPVKYKQFEKMMNEKINEHFADKVVGKKKPVYFLSISVAPQTLDVNLEPNKVSVVLHDEDVILKKLDKILSGYYKLQEPPLSETAAAAERQIDESSEYRDISVTADEDAEVIRATCKKPRLQNEEKRGIRDNTATLRDISKEKMRINCTTSEEVSVTPEPEPIPKNPFRESINTLLKVIPSPHLSDSDSYDAFLEEKPDSGVEKRSDDPGRVEFSPFIENNVTNGASSDWQDEDPAVEDALSQLPMVDLGEDFDLNNILEQTRVEPQAISIKVEKTSSDASAFDVANDSRNSKNFLELWSKGQVPGIKGATDVFTNANLKTSSNSNKEGENPNQPISEKSNQTGFSKFSQEIRKQLLEKNPGMTLPELGKRLAEAWKSLSPEERGFYRDLALEEKKAAELEKKKLKEDKALARESVKNKARLVQMLKSMKNTKSVKKYGFEDRTVATWEINIDTVAKQFAISPEEEEQRVIGSINDVLWAVKSAGKLSVLSSTEVFKATNCADSTKEEVDVEKTASILRAWLTDELHDTSMMHPIYELPVDE